MAKAKPIACDSPDADPQIWLAEVLSVRLSEVMGYADEAAKPDGIKGIHDMRVATRRLRSVLKDFELIMEVSPFKDLNEELKDISDLLGAVRDEDVAIAALSEYLDNVGDGHIRQGIAGLIANRRDSRAKAFSDFDKKVSAKELEKLPSLLADGMKELIEKGTSSGPPTVEEAARKAIIARMDALIKRGPVIFEPNKNKALHKLRLDAKRLRYAIELFAACLGNAVLPFAKEVEKLQSHLGEVHDCDLWISYLATQLKEQSGMEDRTEAWLLSRFVKNRSKSYRGALELWVKWQRNEFVERLRSSLGS